MFDESSRIVNIEIEDQLKKSYMEYSMSVIVARALPDVRDGLKPSQRRILYAMEQLNLRPGGGFRKCAKIAGDTSGNFHPHGEQVVYPTLVRMAQPWNMRYMLVNGQGNFGSIDGDPPAAMRYTEAKLQKTSVELMSELGEETVNYKFNYDETQEEPEVFPTKIPNLLVNGSSGIAVGMATSMAPHNMNEICDAIIAKVDNPELDAKDLRKYIKGPDFPTGGEIAGTEGIDNYFATGRGKIRLKGKAFIENKSNSIQQIIIHEIPYQLNKTLLIEKIASLVKEKKIEDISDVRDESGRQGMRLVVKVKKGFNADVVLNKLFKYTQLQQTFSVINLALVDGEPKVLSMPELVQNFIEFRHEVVERRTQYRLKNAKHKLHLLEGYRIALDNIDAVIATIRASANNSEAQEQLQSKFALSEIQAKAILEMRLQRLTGLEREKIESDYQATLALVSELEGILADKGLRLSIIKEETLEMKKKFGDERRTVIGKDTADMQIEDLIAKEDMVVTISNDGYIKRIPVDTYRTQNRGGRGLSGSTLKDDDFIKNIFVASTHDYILFFSNLGKCYWQKVYDLPQGSRIAKGRPVVNLLPLQTAEKIQAFLSVSKFSDKQNIVMATKNGIVKKSKLSDFSKPRANGIISINLGEGDRLIDVAISEGNNDILLATVNGYANRFKEQEVRTVGRNSKGVRGITLRDTDEVVAMIILKRENVTLLAVCENGYGKRTSADDYKSTRRGSKGYITIKTSQRNGKLVKLLEVLDEDNIIIVTKSGIINRQSVKKISIFSKNTQGVRLITLQKDDFVYDITRVMQEEEHEAEIEQEKLF